jgi:hypothetical protein
MRHRLLLSLWLGRLAPVALGAGAAALIFACQPATKFTVQHSLGAQLGPCADRKDSVRAARGAPYRAIVGDEEDVSDGTQLFEHEWGYRLRAAGADSTAVRDDSVEVVRFRWGHGVRGCEVTAYRAKRHTSRLGLPWESPDGAE